MQPALAKHAPLGRRTGFQRQPRGGIYAKATPDLGLHGQGCLGSTWTLPSDLSCQRTTGSQAHQEINGRSVISLIAFVM